MQNLWMPCRAASHNAFLKNHSAKRITQRYFAAIFACLIMQFPFPSHAETPMSAYQNPYFGEKYNFHYLIQHLVQHTRYEQALKEETPNGLIALDFRGLKKPGFLTYWPDKDVWEKDWAYNDNLEKEVYKGIRGYYKFHWDVGISNDGLYVDTYVCKDYELAQVLFLLEISTSSNMFMPWVECKKKIGTFCMSSINTNRFMFFFYKNVAIKISNATTPQFAEQFAEWLVNVLKGFPLIPMNAPLQFRREPYSTPVFEYLGSEAPAAGDSSEMAPPPAETYRGRLATGDRCPRAGLWRCLEDGRVISLAEGQPMPSANYTSGIFDLLARATGRPKPPPGPAHWEWAGGGDDDN
jgi:hypothetical protein